MDDVGRRLKGNRTALAEEANFAPLAGSLDTGKSGLVIGRTIDRLLYAVAGGQVTNAGDIVGLGNQYLREEIELLCQLQALGHDVGADDLLGTHSFGEHRGR